MQFKVPQFIDVEDKLFGPFTFRQFAYLAGGAGMVFVIYKLLPLWIAILLIIPVAALAGALTFYKVNSKPFIYYLQAGVNYFLSSKLYVWKQRLMRHEDKKNEVQTPTKVSNIVPMSSPTKLNDLAWSLDIEEKENSKNKE